MAKIRVYRVETEVNSEMYGPFTAVCHDSSLKKAFIRFTNQMIGCPPTPEEDNIKNFTSGMHSGICHFYHFDIWFQPVYNISELFEDGFQLSVYEVDKENLSIGGTQCVWNPKLATFIKSIKTHEGVCDLYDQLFEEMEAIEEVA